MLKYIILNEIELFIITSKNNDWEIMIFDSKEEAIEYAQKNIQSWQVIEIPFNED